MRTFATLGVVIAAAVTPSLTAAPEPRVPTPTPAPLRIDMDRHISDLLARHGSGGLPRFEERIDVVERMQPALDALLRGVDRDCGPTSGGPPPASELNAYRGATIPPHADFLALGKLLAKGISRLRHPKPRWFVYRVRRGGVVRTVLREGEANEATRLGAAGVAWEEVARFHDLGRAVGALRRLERGFATAERRTSGDRLPPWVATTCRPPGFR